MMNEIKVSVIIPVYNAGKHLRQCIDSVLAQSLKDIEIICVDDGSDDQSVDILEEYQKNDQRIIILKQEHLFAGTARNYGKSIAKGEYLVFWDADDYFMPDALEAMYEQCVRLDADVCICSGRQYFEDGGFEAPCPRYLRKSEIPEQEVFNAKSEPDHILSITVEAPWNKMFRRSFIEETQLDFQSIRNANDVYFVICALCMAERVTVLDQQLVCYRKDKKTGLVATVNKNIKSAIGAWRAGAQYLKEHDAFPKRSFANRALESIIYLLHNVSDWDSFEEGFRYIQDNGILDELSIFEETEEGYYYMPYHKEAAHILRTGTPEEYAKLMWRSLYIKEDKASARLRALKEKSSRDLQKLRKEKQDIKDSFSFKAGRAITYLPRKIRDILKH